VCVCKALSKMNVDWRRHSDFFPLFLCPLWYFFGPNDKQSMTRCGHIEGKKTCWLACHAPWQGVSYVSIRQHTSAYIRQHTSAYVRGKKRVGLRVTPLGKVCHTSAYVSIRQHTYVSIRQPTSAYVLACYLEEEYD
jgi:hypothetical protein